MRFSDLAGRRVGVWGAGREGLAAHSALREQDLAREVLIYTDEPVPDEPAADDAAKQGHMRVSA